MTEQDNAHSTLPWRLNPKATLNVETPKGRGIASCGGHADGRIEDSGYSENVANAEFIVTACNQFYENKALISELVEALERIKQRANESGGGQMALINTIHDMNGTARAALKKAGAQ